MRDSESRFRSLSKLSSDWYWEQDKEYRFIDFSGGTNAVGWGPDQPSALRLRRWELSGALPASGSWAEHKALLEAHMPFRDFEYHHTRLDGTLQYLSASGEPVFDASGRFTGYRGVATDIAERKRAADELRRSESLKSAIVASSLDGVITIDHEGKIVEFNPAAETTFGLTRGDALGKEMVELIVPPRLRDAHRRGFAHYLATGKGTILGKRLELEAIRADGAEFPIELTISAIATSSMPMFTGFIRDITERKRSEMALKESELRYHSLFEHMLEGYAYCRALFEQDQLRDFIYLEVNSAFAKLTGLKDVVGKKVSDVIPGVYESNPDVFETYGRVVLTGKPEKFETYIESLGIWFSVAVFSYEKEHFAAVFDNITERKKIEEEIHETRNFLASIFDNIPNSIFVKDAKDLRFVRLNPAGEKLIGYSEKELLGKNDYDFFPKDQADFFVAKDRETLSSGERLFVVEETLTAKDGTRKILQSKKFPILDKGGHPQYLLGMSEDITERKHAEQSLLERAQIAALGADVGAALTRGESLEEMLQQCCEAIVGHLHAAFARIWTLNERDDMLELRASAGMYVHLDGPHGRVPVGKFKIGLIARERKPHLTNQVVGDARVGDQEWAKREGMVAFAGYPLLARDQLVGVVAMFARNPLADVTLQGLASISNNIALGIERNHAEARVRDSEAKYRGLIEQASDGIFITDAQGNYQLANSRACKLLGYAESELIGMHGSVTHLEGDRDTYASRLLAVADGEVLRYERMMKRRDHSVFPAEVSANKLGDASVQFIFRDITERRQAEASLRESEGRFRSFAEQSPDAMIIHQAGTIVFVNAAMVRLMRAGDAGALLGKPGISLLQAGQVDAGEKRRARLYSGQTVPLIDQVYLRSDGTTVEVEAAASPIVLEGQPAALVTVRDITDRRIQEQKIARLSRIHAVLSGINSAIVRIRDRQELFNEACRIAVEHGGFRLGWIAMLDHCKRYAGAGGASGSADGSGCHQRICRSCGRAGAVGHRGNCIARETARLRQRHRAGAGRNADQVWAGHNEHQTHRYSAGCKVSHRAAAVLGGEGVRNSFAVCAGTEFLRRSGDQVVERVGRRHFVRPRVHRQGREGRIPRLLRCAHRTREPHPVSRASWRSTCAARPAAGTSLPCS